MVVLTPELRSGTKGFCGPGSTRQREAAAGLPSLWTDAKAKLAIAYKLDERLGNTTAEAGRGSCGVAGKATAVSIIKSVRKAAGPPIPPNKKLQTRLPCEKVPPKVVHHCLFILQHPKNSPELWL